ncbi:MAG: cysteine desulfurase [Rickettsiaceae bacterium]|nr:cysteine desulfurase [Rickettsiaceae bacterium]MDP4832195.1 cysteine desulfurase [Rickettsiaceae bacterium]MDP5021225.1 cysteine desulfurase [Rickettsiaceae bacterium]MDP5083201.1 cysteine desulfurase [Rickettsiaceae bacterium]
MIYLDHNATTHMHPNVKKKMQELLEHEPLNPSSIHSYGRKGKSVLEIARKSIASLLGIADCFNDYQITFTSSGTEANNLLLSNFKDGEIFIAATEHPSIFAHSKISDNITIIRVDKNGVLDLEDLISKLQSCKSKKKLVSVMLANNETGVIQPIEQISHIAHDYGALMHSDCVQAAGKIEINIPKLNVDFVSISAHKFGGPMGAAALIGKAAIPLLAIFIGGGQERNLRSGTENVPAIVGFGEAAHIVKAELGSRFEHMNKLHIKLETALLESDHDIEIASVNVNRLPNTSLIMNVNKKAETQLIALDLQGVAVSSGSACSSGKATSSHVLLAMDYPEDKISSALRISIGVSTTEQDIDNFLKIYNNINE